MTLKQGMGARNVAFKCLQMAALSEQDGDREKADHWRKEASGCFRISAEQLYFRGYFRRGQTREIALRVCGHMEVPGIRSVASRKWIGVSLYQVFNRFVSPVCAASVPIR